MEGFDYVKLKPDGLLSGFVESFQLSANHTEKDKNIILFPDGRVDVMFRCKDNGSRIVELFNLDKKARPFNFTAKTRLFMICFTLIGVEFLLEHNLATLEADEIRLPDDFFGVTDEHLKDFDSFVKKVSDKLVSILPENIDDRKRKLFEHIYASKGEMSVKELAEKVFWSSRQINRYFNQQFGISLKTYCQILRFRDTFHQIREGKLYPEKNFSDQAHFIREIKKFAGFIPKELSRNRNGQFIQLSALPDK